MPKQRRLTPDERRATLAAFLPPGDDMPTGAEIMLPIGHKRLPIAARLRSVQGATDDDRAKRNEQPAPSPEWIETPKQESAR